MKYTPEDWITEDDKIKCDLLNEYKKNKNKKTAEFINEYGFSWSWAVQKTNCYKDLTPDGEIYKPKEQSKKNSRNIYREEFSHLVEVRNKQVEHKKIVANINLEVIEQMKELQKSEKNILGLNFGELIEISMRLYIERKNKEDMKELFL